jgi:hypothetical protein
VPASDEPPLPQPASAKAASTAAGKASRRVTRRDASDRLRCAGRVDHE